MFKNYSDNLTITLQTTPKNLLILSCFLIYLRDFAKWVKLKFYFPSMEWYLLKMVEICFKMVF
ncbi:hypothetical protein SAMN05421761_11553 [Belliella pelovolcani]|uniref:Uncharacterized protein n=1 Tax=Belliella pelovolcani TaxID=529505 RepID=A0A1N7PC47_9BACT|nr:hypothetical protein SAMN05421761_11553 [Belliella pelovolcani]